jgi:hypothetical protein
VSAFFAAPLLYAACNILATPKVDSIYTIWDEHSREPNLESNGSIVPEICDLDVATINALVDYNESVETVDGTWYGLRAFRIEKIRKMTLVRGTQSMISDA